jgi:diguanylate cyclase (GGDEF)-like protein/PAS domain S-box-containing protein
MAFLPQLAALADETASISTWEWILSTDELSWTSGQSEIYGHPCDKIDSTAAWESLIHEDDRVRVRSAVANAVDTGAGFHERFRLIDKDGKTLWIIGFGKVVSHIDGSAKIVGVNLEVTDWVEALVASETRFTSTFEQAAMGIAHVALDGTWLNVNRRCLEIVGYPKEELLRLTFADLTHPDDLETDWSLVRELLDGNRTTYSMEKRYFTKERRMVWVNLTVSLVRKHDGRPDYFISVIEDITPRKQIELERDKLIAELEERVRERTKELERISLTDPLTGIANRRCFDQCLQAEWDRAVRTRQSLSVVLVDVDFFKNFNDRAGHASADEALKAVAGCLSQAAQRSADIAARYGGDEFVLILPDTRSDGALAIAERLQQMIESLKIKNPGSPNSGQMTVSQGVATATPESKGTWRGLLLEADLALYDAKNLGRGRIAAFKSRHPQAPAT